jgi:hypothetical protein
MNEGKTRRIVSQRNKPKRKAKEPSRVFQANQFTSATRKAADVINRPQQPKQEFGRKISTSERSEAIHGSAG